jgi:hypothetical protein
MNLAHFILTNPDYDNKEILICYPHSKIPALIYQLITQAGGAPLDLADYPGDRFDLTYVVTYIDKPPTFSTPYVVTPMNKGISLTVTIQKLLFGDPTTLPPSPFPFRS